MYNMQQITNFSDVMDTASTVTHRILVGNDHYITAEYAVLTVTALIGNLIPIIKLGYVCEPKGIDYPIYLMSQGTVKEFYLGKTGMFEIQPETFKDINDEEAQELTHTPQITAIHVPRDIVFKLDYVYNIN